MTELENKIGVVIKGLMPAIEEAEEKVTDLIRDESLFGKESYTKEEFFTCMDAVHSLNFLLEMKRSTESV